jgi:hypothetical protein
MNLLVAQANTPATVAESPSATEEQKPATTPDAVVKLQLQKYYDLKAIDKEAARELLNHILTEQPNNIQAHLELGYSLLAEKKLNEAKEQFAVALQLDASLVQAQKQIEAIDKELTAPPVVEVVAKAPPAPKLPEDQELMQEFYKLQKIDIKKAGEILEIASEKFPHNLLIQKQKGYFLLNNKETDKALAQFQYVEELTPEDEQIKLQVAYLLSESHQQREAFEYFKRLSYSKDTDLEQKANVAMTNLSGLESKMLPEPWFFDTYYAPLFFSRFNLYVFPLQMRAGRKFGKNHEWEVYGITRATYDNNSNVNSNTQLSQIFDDNSIIFDAGIRYAPFAPYFPSFKLLIEGGKAYTLVLNTPTAARWRNDGRGGFIMDKSWGALPRYAPEFVLPFKYVGKMYADTLLYSRYAGNIIGFFTTKQGIRLAEYHESALDFYVRVRASADKQHQFFNNFVEVGPGIEFYPTNRYSVSLRLEFLRGYYINVDSPSPNPYPPTYYNTLGLLEFYIYL